MRKISIIFVLFKIAYINSAYSNDIDKVLCKRVIDNGKIISSNDNIKNRRINTGCKITKITMLSFISILIL